MNFARQQTLPRLKALDRALRAATAHPEDAEAIHDARVAARRMIQCLRVFAPVFDAGAVRKLRKRLRKLLDRCAAVRNCDITLELLEQAGFTAKSGLVARIRKQRRAAARALTEHLERWRGRHLLRTWPQRLFAASDAEPPVPDFPALTQELFEQGRAAAADGATYEQMHRFRLLAKRYRYSLEIFQPCYDAAAIEGILKALRGIQERLGAMNDCVTALQLVEGHRGATRALERILARRTQAFRTHWRRHFSRRKLQAWTSIFSATAKPNPARQPPRKPAAGSHPPDAVMSAAS
jgi:CHAD domain-containing protein